VLDVRVYRAAFLPALVALFVAAFSLVDRPPPVTTSLDAEAFDGARAFGTADPPPRNSLRELVRAFPDRRPGSAGDRALAGRVARALAATDPATRHPLFEVTRSTVAGGPRDAGDLATVVGVRTGLSSRRVVVLAHRDAARPGSTAELSATAALLELVRVVRARDLQKTLVLVSTSGGSTGFAGARAWAQTVDPALVDGVIVLGDLAGRRVRRPWVVPWRADAGAPPLGLERTLESALRRESGSQPGGARATAQWIRRAVPATVSEQGVLGDAGIPAALIGISGERGPAAGEAVTRRRLQSSGRAVLRALTAIDAAGGRGAAAGPAFRRDPRGIVTVRNVLPDWAVRLVVGTLLLPALLTALDAFFRIRRRRIPTAPWFAWMGSAAAAVLAAWLWARALGLVGLLDAPPALVAPEALPISGGGAVALGSTVLAAALAAVGVRLAARPLTRARGQAASGGLGAVLGAVLALGTALAWVANPYLAALLLPAAHLWLFAGRPQGRLRSWPAWLGVAAGVVLPLLVVVYYAAAFAAGPVDLAWLLLLGAAAGNVSVPTLIVAGAYAAALAGIVAVVRAQRRVDKEAPKHPIRTRGPLSYAGPGSLGGTDSALRR
jgi:hypothetical protein